MADKNSRLRLTVRWRGTTVLRRTVRTVRRMRARHVDTVRAWIPRLRRIAEVRLVMLETDHVRVGRVPPVSMLIVLRHQWHWHVAHRAWIRLHVRYLADHLRHVCHLRKFQPVIKKQLTGNISDTEESSDRRRWELENVGRDIEDTRRVGDSESNLEGGFGWCWDLDWESWKRWAGKFEMAKAFGSEYWNLQEDWLWEFEEWERILEGLRN